VKYSRKCARRNADRVYYLDTSALVKLMMPEAETEALHAFLNNVSFGDRFTSAVTRTELLRAANRYGTGAIRVARELLDGVTTITITESLLDAAGTIGPSALRTLDAIHLVSALELGSDLTAVVAYDKRLLDAAAHIGLPAVTPA
jgi:uncharacterized protein